MDRYHSALAEVPPLVRARAAGGLVYLLAWVQIPEGLRARITWVSQWRDQPEPWRWEVAEIPADQVAEIPRQVYTGVPRESRGSHAWSHLMSASATGSAARARGGAPRMGTTKTSRRPWQQPTPSSLLPHCDPTSGRTRLPDPGLEGGAQQPPPPGTFFHRHPRRSRHGTPRPIPVLAHLGVEKGIERLPGLTGSLRAQARLLRLSPAAAPGRLPTPG